MKGEVEIETRDGQQQQKWTSELMMCFVFVLLSKIGLEPIWEEKDPGRKKS